MRQPVIIGKGECLGRLVEEEIKRIDDLHVGGQVSLDTELAGLLGEDGAGQIVTLRILLPVQKVMSRFDAQAVADDRCAAVRGRPQADDLEA